MGDVAQILGVAKDAKGPVEGASFLADTKKPSAAARKKPPKPQGMSREVFALIGSEGLPPLAPSGGAKASAGAFKRKRVTGSEGKWLWTGFGNSARKDGFKPKHWQRAGVEYPDYPFSRFNVALEHVSYTDDEYDRYLTQHGWTRSETDYLVHLCHRLDLRWPVIADRYQLTPRRPLEDLQARYYGVVQALILSRSQTASKANAASAAAQKASEAPGPGLPPAAAAAPAAKDAKEAAGARHVAASKGNVGDSQKKAAKSSAGAAMDDKSAAAAAAKSAGPPAATVSRAALSDVGLTLLGTGGSLDNYNKEFEAMRRKQLALLFRRTRAEEAEEAQLRAELKALEAQLKKAKRAGGGRQDANALKQSLLEARRMMSRAAPQSGTPYLQSMRLESAPSESSGGGGATLSRGLLRKTALALKEFGVEERPRMPSKLLCDLQDALREEIVVMLTLQKLVNRREGELSSVLRQRNVSMGRLHKHQSQMSAAAKARAGQHANAQKQSAKQSKVPKGYQRPHASQQRANGRGAKPKAPGKHVQKPSTAQQARLLATVKSVNSAPASNAAAAAAAAIAAHQKQEQMQAAGAQGTAKGKRGGATKRKSAAAGGGQKKRGRASAEADGKK